MVNTIEFSYGIRTLWNRLSHSALEMFLEGGGAGSVLTLTAGPRPGTAPQAPHAPHVASTEQLAAVSSRHPPVFRQGGLSLGLLCDPRTSA